MGELRVSIKYGEMEAEFSGEPVEVYHQVVRFLEQVIPQYSLARKLARSVGLSEILEGLGWLMGHDEREGIFFTEPLSDKPVQDAILLYALKNYVEHELGRREAPSTTLSELSHTLSKGEKTVSGRLSELVQKGLLRRLDRGGYVITQAGIRYIVEKYRRQLG